MITITSSQNPLIKEIRSLKNRKYREEKKLFFVEGARLVEEALKEDAPVVRIFVSQQQLASKNGYAARLLSGINSRGYETIILPEKLFKEISDTESPQGFMAVIRTRFYNLEEILDKGDLFIILDSLQDPGNMGTIIRTADAAGFTGVIVSKGSVDVYNPKVLRSTMGAIFRVPVCFSENIIETVDLLSSKGVKICAAHLKGTENYFDVDMQGSTAIIIGNEANGISDVVASHAHALVKIPMVGKAESLNASVAAGLLMYEAVRQRHAAGKR